MNHDKFYFGWRAGFIFILVSVLTAHASADELPSAKIILPDSNTELLATAAAESLTEETVSEDTPLETKKQIKNLWVNFNPPRDDKYDWIQLSSGEWLKGELISLYSFSVEFDSDELNLLKIDWDDIKQIRSAKPMSMRIEAVDSDETITVIGKLQLLDNTAVIVDGEKVTSFQRFQIISIAKGAGNEFDFWSGKISFGANVKKGNSDSVDSNIAANIQRRTASSRFINDYIGNFSQSQGIDTSNNHRFNSYYDSFLNRKFFWRVYSAEYHRDTFRNIDNQISLGSSFGYDIIRTSKTEWEISGGIGGLYTQFVSVGPTEDIESRSPYIGFGTKYDTEVTGWMDYLFDFKFQLVEESAGTYTHHLVTTLSSDITGDLDLDVSFVWDRVSDPQPAADLTVPEKDDVQLIVAVSYEF